MTTKPDDSDDAPHPDASRRELLEGLGLAGLFAALPGAAEAKPQPRKTPKASLDKALRHKVKTVVVIFAENRSFNNLFAGFPGLQQPLESLPPERARQRD